MCRRPRPRRSRPESSTELTASTNDSTADQPTDRDDAQESTRTISRIKRSTSREEGKQHVSLVAAADADTKTTEASRSGARGRPPRAHERTAALLLSCCRSSLSPQAMRVVNHDTNNKQKRVDEGKERSIRPPRIVVVDVFHHVHVLVRAPAIEAPPWLTAPRNRGGAPSSAQSSSSPQM